MDAERVARRLYEVEQMLTPRPGWETRVQRRSMLSVRWEHLSEDERRLRVAAVDELLRSEVIFPGPSLYADPSV